MVSDPGRGKEERRKKGEEVEDENDNEDEYDWLRGPDILQITVVRH
jgi:hypothetical protein